MTLSCPKCSDPYIAAAPAGSDQVIECGNCRAQVRALAFEPAPRAEPPRRIAAAPGHDAACFFCEGQAATAACEICGRFTCGRCEVDWSGQRVCLTCLHALREERKADAFVNRRTIHDNLSLSLVLWPLAVPVYGIFLSFLLSPVALYFLVKNWNGSRGIVPRGRARQVTALVLAILGTLTLIGLGVAAVFPFMLLFRG